MDISLYSKTLRAVDKMLHMQVFVYSITSIGEELLSIFHCFVKHFCSLEKTDLTLVALQGMRDCSNYSTQVAATLMAVLTVDFKPTPTDVAMALHKIVQHSQYGPHVRLFFPELFVVLIFQIVSSRALKSLEVTNLPIHTHFCHQPLYSWLRWKLHCILGTEVTQANTWAFGVTWALCLGGLEEEVLIERLDLNLQGHTGKFVWHFIAFTVQRCGREAHRLLGLNIPPAAAEAPTLLRPSEPRAALQAPGPGPAPSGSPASSNRDRTLGRTPQELDGCPSYPCSNPVTVTMEQAAPHEAPAYHSGAGEP
ncbi:hypothetical protein ASZ78_004346 [Callipepla squamata]|uniref:Uncharacterized protein n=1 Tax=Callipepla squamata TaxID=9009 RepID=A0A226MAT1_CALSU|nr:hypothetical protein ASZ78_004346 [Callipepla squamata]